jgi:hypothetical protein
MNIQSLGTIRLLVLKLSLGSHGKKYHLGVTLTNNYKIYYRLRGGGSGASFQRLWAM